MMKHTGVKGGCAMRANVFTVGAKVGCVALMTVSLALNAGCATGSVAHDKLQENVKGLLENSKLEKSLPAAASRFCLDRARANFESASAHSRLDGFLLGSAAVFGATGLTFQALGAGLPTPTNDPQLSPKKGFEVAGLTTLAFAGGILAIRTAAGQSELALAKRTAAARQVDAALVILAEYALSDSVDEVSEKGIGACRDADIEVAVAYPALIPGGTGGGPTEPAKKKVEQKEAAADKSHERVEALTGQEKAKAASEAAAVAFLATAQAAASKSPKDLALQVKAAEAKGEKTKAELDRAAAAESLRAATQDALCRDEEVRLAEAQLGVVSAALRFRKALFFGTTRDSTWADADLTAAEQLLKSRRTGQAQACAPARPAPPGQ